jgi:3D (Asp-Asp-Asp) domain-containing protein
MVRSVFASETWKVTSYCACSKCCGKSDGITASGKKAQYGMVACNWLAFGTKVRISNLGTFTVADRGAKSLFGSKNNHIKHIDVYMSSHSQALKFGVKYLTVSILKEK